METTRFDAITSTFAGTSTRRGALRVLAAAAFGAGGLAILGQDEGQARKKGGKKKGGKGKGGKGGGTNGGGAGTGGTGTGAGTGGAGTSVATRGLREICTPGQDTCSAGLQCGAPTTRHSCSSSVQGINALCCIPAGGQCSGECDCCGDNYCSYDDNNVGHCVPNPEL